MMDYDPTGGTACIECTGPRNGEGYGWTRVNLAGGRRWRPAILAHRLAFERAWGVTLRADQIVRHACDNRGCVNPLHLMVGAPADNSRDMTQRGRQWNQRKTHCPRGHSLEDWFNLVPSALAEGKRKCRECDRLQSAESYARRKAAG